MEGNVGQTTVEETLAVGCCGLLCRRAMHALLTKLAHCGSSAGWNGPAPSRHESRWQDEPHQQRVRVVPREQPQLIRAAMFGSAQPAAGAA